MFESMMCRHVVDIIISVVLFVGKAQTLASSQVFPSRRPFRKFTPQASTMPESVPVRGKNLA
jgi:hypothetical protein